MWTSCRALLTVTVVLKFLSGSQVLSFHNLGEEIKDRMPTYDTEAIMWVVSYHDMTLYCEDYKAQIVQDSAARSDQINLIIDVV